MGPMISSIGRIIVLATALTTAATAERFEGIGPNDWSGWRGPTHNGVAAAGQAASAHVTLSLDSHLFDLSRMGVLRLAGGTVDPAFGLSVHMVVE